MIMWNPRLISGDVGIGLNVRRLRERLLNKCTTVYHVRPLGTMTIFRKYPGLWQVFLDDVKRPGHLILAKEQSSRPSLDQLDTLMLSGGESEAAEQPSAFVKAVGVFNSLNRFMRSLSK
jgi:DICT domain-containing protein